MSNYLNICLYTQLYSSCEGQPCLSTYWRKNGRERRNGQLPSDWELLSVLGVNSLPSFRCRIYANLSPGHKKQALCRVLWQDWGASCTVGLAEEVPCGQLSSSFWKELKEVRGRRRGGCRAVTDWLLAALPCSTPASSEVNPCPQTLLGSPL